MPDRFFRGGGVVTGRLLGHYSILVTGRVLLYFRNLGSIYVLTHGGVVPECDWETDVEDALAPRYFGSPGRYHNQSCNRLKPIWIWCMITLWHRNAIHITSTL